MEVHNLSRHQEKKRIRQAKMHEPELPHHQPWFYIKSALQEGQTRIYQPLYQMHGLQKSALLRVQE